MTTLRLIATYDGWIFSASGNTAIKGRNGSARRTTDLYIRLCSECHGEMMKTVQSAILMGDIEVAGEGCGKLIQNLNYACENQTKTNCRPPGEPWPNGLFPIKGPQNNLQNNNLPAV